MLPTKRVTEAGIYDIPLDDYIHDPAPAPSLNAGTACTLLTQSPLHAWLGHPRLNPDYEKDTTSRLEIGTIAHALLLEDDSSKVVVIDAEDWRTKAAKDARDEARAAGKTPILKKDHANVLVMVDTAKEFILETDIADDFFNGVPEQTLIWQHDDIWLRCRPDRRSQDWRVIFDYKTVAGSAHPGVFGKKLPGLGYDLQAELNLRGVEALVNPRMVTFIFIVQEIEPPYACSLVSLSPAWQALASKKLQMAMSLWKGCLRTKNWPGYANRVAYLDPPAYAETNWLDNLPEVDAEDIVA